MSEWRALGQAYRQHLTTLGRSPLTLDRYDWLLARFFGFCEAQGWRLRELTAANVEAYQLHLLRDPGPLQLWNEATVWSGLVAVRRFFDWVVAGDRTLFHPGPERQRKRPAEPLIPLLTVDQLQAMLESPDPNTPVGQRDRAILELLYSTGLRRRECHQLDLPDLDLAGRTLTVRRGKGGPGRVQPMGDHLVEVLELYLAQGRPGLRPVPGERALFLSSHTGRRISYGLLKPIVARAGAAVGCAASPHDLRHACGSHLLEGGADLRHVQGLLGHRRVSSTQRYTHLEPLELMREHRHTHPRGKKR